MTGGERLTKSCMLDRDRDGMKERREGGRKEGRKEGKRGKEGRKGGESKRVSQGGRGRKEGCEGE